MRMLRSLARSGRVGSGYLLQGPSGVGKARAAVAWAASMLCLQRDSDDACGACSVCTRVADGVHPDVRVFAPREEGSGNIAVDFLREEILPLTRFAPFEASRSFFIFPDVDVSFSPAHPQAANALLKTLEEPRPNVHFILTTSRPDHVLQTVRSRCQNIGFARLSHAVVVRLLCARGVEPRRAEWASALASGRMDRALQWATEEGDALLRRVFELHRIVLHGTMTEQLKCAESLAKDPLLGEVLQTWLMVCRAQVMGSLGLHANQWGMWQAIEPVESVESVESGANGPQAVSQQEPTTLEPRVGAYIAEQVHRALGMLQRNANPQMLLDALFTSVRSA